MLYIQRKPAAPLSGFTQWLWYHRAQGELSGRERILPSGCVQVVINLQRDFLLDCPDPHHVCPAPPSLVVGARSVFETIDRSDMADLIGVVFQPAGFAAFAGDAVDLFSHRGTALDALWGSSATLLRDRLREVPSAAAKLDVLEEFLVAHLKPQLAPHPMIRFALERFADGPVVANVAEVAAESGLSMRRFSQVFREQVGLPPKLWCRIRRFQRALRQLHAGVDMPWSELALECGYYDQSHFANDFRAFSGIDATSYLARRGPWANHIAS